VQAAGEPRPGALPAHFQVYSIWEGDECLPWDTTVEWCALLDLVPVPVLYRGPLLPAEQLTSRWRAATAGRESEGYVVRGADSFDRHEFDRSVLKYVRSGHVQTTTHWMNEPLRVNGLADPTT
jgi:hypothetical protein